MHYEPSIDAISWEKREARYRKKFEAARKYIFKEVFLWVPPSTTIQQIGVFITHPNDIQSSDDSMLQSLPQFKPLPV